MKTQLYFEEVSSSEEVLNNIDEMDRLVSEGEAMRKQAIANAYEIGLYCVNERKKMGNDLFNTFVDTKLAAVGKDRLAICIKIANKFEREQIEDLGSKEVARLLIQGEMKSITSSAEGTRPPPAVFDALVFIQKFSGVIDKMGGIDSLNDTQLHEARALMKPYSSLIRHFLSP